MRASLLTCLAGSVLIIGTANVQAGSFIDDSKISLRYSNYYWNEDPDDGWLPLYRNEWVHAARASFQSGFFNDIFALDYAIGGAKDLKIGDDATFVTNLPKTPQTTTGIGGTIEAYGKLRLLNTDEHSLLVGYGKKTRKRVQYQDNTTRILPASTVGFDVDYKRGGLNLYFTQFDKFSPRHLPAGFGDSLKTKSGDTIDNMRIYGVGYALPTGTELKLEYAESKQYLKSTFAQVAHKFDLGEKRAISLSASYGNQQDAGSLFGKEHEATFVDLQSKYSFSNYYVGLAYNQVSDGNFEETFFAADHGHFASSAKMFYMFGLEGEDTVKLSAGMSFADFGIPQMRWDIHYGLSDGAKNITDLERSELQSVMQYRFDGDLKGLSLAWLHTEFDTNFTGAPHVVNNAGAPTAATIDHHADRFYVNYTYNF